MYPAFPSASRGLAGCAVRRGADAHPEQLLGSCVTEYGAKMTCPWPLSSLAAPSSASAAPAPSAPAAPGGPCPCPASPALAAGRGAGWTERAAGSRSPPALCAPPVGNSYDRAAPAAATQAAPGDRSRRPLGFTAPV